MNIPVLSLENANVSQLEQQSAPTLTFERMGKFMSSAHRDAYRKKAIQEIRRALKSERDF